MPTTKATRLTCATLHELDNGILGVMVDDEIRHICNDRHKSPKSYRADCFGLGPLGL